MDEKASDAIRNGSLREEILRQDARQMNETTMLWVIDEAARIFEREINETVRIAVERQIKEARAALEHVKELGDNSSLPFAMGLLYERVNRLIDAIRNKPDLDKMKDAREGRRKGWERSRETRAAAAKRKGIIAAIKSYKGDARSMAANIAKRFDVDRAYVRKINRETKAELSIT